MSPLLAKVYLHYVFDLWIETWRKKVAVGEVIVVRYADILWWVSKAGRKPNVFSASFENGWPGSAWNCMARRRD